MNENHPLFADEIAANKAAEVAPAELISLETDESSLELRLRGAFMTSLQLTSPSTGRRDQILYSSPDLTMPQLTASHSAVPAGPSTDPGGQHGPLRWSDTHEFPLDDGPNGEKRVALQMKRGDTGLGISKTYELTSNSLTRTLTVSNPGDEKKAESALEHDYHAVPEERIGEVTINGQRLDEIYSKTREDGSFYYDREEDGTLYYRDFNGDVVVGFPDGRELRLTASFNGISKYPLLLEIWHRKGTDSVGLEPAIGLKTDAENDGLMLEPYDSATLTTKVEYL